MLYEYSLKLPTDQLEQAIERLTIAGIYNLYYEPSIEVIKVKNGYDFEEVYGEYTELKVYAEKSEVDSADSYMKLIQDTLSLPKEKIIFDEINETNWNTSFEDVDLGNDWILCYSGLVDQYPSKHILKFEPQAAFGTGLHETTQDSLRIILNYDFSGKSFLDLGTGSGVLSIGAALKGANKILAVDLEPVEREIRHNAQLNDIQSGLEIVEANLLEGSYYINQEYDWICINIGADETEKIVERHDLISKSNHFLISGIVDWNSEALVNQFISQGFSIEEQRQTNEWMTYYFKKIGPSSM